MARGVSYFQRFSQPENHATNNTLLALKYFYQSSPFKIEQLLNDLLETELSIGLSFEQQIKSKESVPDALISQQPVRIFIETKTGNAVDVDQIKRHLKTISSDTIKNGKDFLLALTKEPIQEQMKEQLTKTAQSKRIAFASVTFSRLLEGLEAQCADYERDLRAVLEDFKSYLTEAGLLDERNKWLVIFPCGTSFEENLRLRVYYEPQTRPTKAGYSFIGIYRQKIVSHVGRVESVAIVSFENKKYSFTTEAGCLTEEHKRQIIETIEDTSYYDLKSEPRRFYVVDRFVETESKKISPNGLWGFRYLDLSKLIPGYDSKVTYSSESLATAINGSTWT
jgi:hypothetical protein